MANFVLSLLSIGILVTWGTYEVIRFRRARAITQSQRAEYIQILNFTACTDPNVHSVKQDGHVINCQAVRLVLLQDEQEHSFMLWWETSFWVDLWKKATENTFVFLTLACVLIVALLYFASQTFLQHRMMKMFTTPPPPMGGGGGYYYAPQAPHALPPPPVGGGEGYYYTNKTLQTLPTAASNASNASNELLAPRGYREETEKKPYIPPNTKQINKRKSMYFM